MAEAVLAPDGALPVGPTGRHGLGWWGAGTLIASEGALFVYLLFSYYYVGAISPPGWVLEPHPPLHLALPNTVLLLLSSVVAWAGEHGVLHRKRAQALIGFGGAAVMGIIFAIVQVVEWRAKTFGIGSSSYGSLYYVTTGFHMAHVLVGIGILIGIFVWTALDYFSPRRHMSVSAGVLYWHFVDAVWLLVFATYYITPYLGFGR